MTAIPRLPDETLNHWADVYVQRQLADLGISLEDFLRHPQRTLEAVERRIAMRDATACRRRHRATDPCDADDQALTVRGGRLIEKLRHGPRRRQPTEFARRLFHRLFRSASW